MVFASPDVQGLGICHLYTLQGMACLKDILTYCDTDHMLGQLYKCSLKALMIETGLGHELFDHPYKKYKHLTEYTSTEAT